MNRLAGFLLGVLLASAPLRGALAHGTTANDLPLSTVSVRTRHVSPAELVALFARGRQPGGGSGPRAARAGVSESLLPEGIDGLLRTGDELAVTGFEDRFARLLDCVSVLDVPREVAGSGVRLTLALRHASPRELRLQALALEGRGKAHVEGHSLTLEGSPAWIHRALRQVIRAELGLRQPLPAPAS